jgi:hypothetical protein
LNYEDRSDNTYLTKSSSKGKNATVSSRVS